MLLLDLSVHSALGFPDDETSAWGSIYTALEKDFKIISTCLPGYENGGIHRPWGYTFEDIVDKLDTTITSLHFSDTNTPIVLIVHDWGSYIGCLYQNKFPNKVKAMVIADVLITTRDARPSLYKTLVVMSYQLCFAGVFLARQLFGETVGSFATALSQLYLSLVPFLSPLKNEKLPRTRKEIKAHMYYPYYHLWRNIFLGIAVKPKLPECPLLYLWGERKNIMFHDDSVIQSLSQRPQSKAVSFKSSGHWLMRTETESVLRAMRTFLRQFF